MPTPSIQTLRADAQQVLNLDSISAVRSVVAATLANANAGTPLNPNLTTQQLWNEFYQIVTQPKSDIESIIANQLMKFLFAPPAPGGAGADKQVIFNDGGVLAGDPQFLWNKTTNLLTVTGAATITGDLTVATDAFKVISATKDVCIGTVTPTFNNKLTVVGGAGGDAFITSGNGTRTGYIGTDGTNVIMGAYSNHPLRIHVNDYPQMEVAALGVFNWYDGAGGTRMTLNSTGLGVGVASPAFKLQVVGTSGSLVDLCGSNVAGLQTLVRIRTASANTNGLLIQGNVSNDEMYINNFYNAALSFGTANTERLRIDGTGNVGIGVTPSAWSAGGFVQLPNSRAFAFAGASGDYISNGYYDGSWKYTTTAAVSRYRQDAGSHQWFTAPSGTAGNAITFTQAMTLDASGRLILLASTTTPATLSTNGQLTFTATSDTNLRFSYRGSDGVTRVANLTLA